MATTYAYAPSGVPLTGGRLDWSEIIWKLEQRRSNDGWFLRSMTDVRDAYNGDATIVALPDVSKEPTLSAPIPALVQDAVDNIAMSASTTRPQMWVPAMDGTKGAANKARTHRRALQARWHENGMEIQIRGAYRQWAAYGTACFVVLPDFKRECARIERRDPLGVYPDFRHPDDVDPPRNVGFVYGRSKEWILAKWGGRDTYGAGGPTGYKLAKLLDDRGARSEGELWDVLEWVDENDIVLGVIGPRWRTTYNSSLPNWPIGGVEVARWRNRAGMVPVAIPHRVTLDRVIGQVTNVVGIVNLLARLTALDIIATEKAIFQDMVVISHDGRDAQLVNGRWRDGREGEPNFIRDGDVKLLTGVTGPATHPVQDRLERAARITGANPAMNGGELNGALRSGQTVNALAGIAVDPRVQEANEVMARTLAAVNRGITNIEKGYWPAKKYVCFSGWPSDKTMVTYTPEVDFATDANTVEYALPGADANHVSIAVLQLVSAELMSRQTARVKHPYIDDPEGENRQVIEEQIVDAVLKGFEQQVQTGALPLADLGMVLKHYRTDGDLVGAILKQQEEAQARQAAVPASPTAPEAMPGLSLPGQGVEAQGQPPEPPPTIGPPPASLENFKSILSALRAHAGTNGSVG